MALKEAKKGQGFPNRNPVKIDLNADSLRDFEGEIAKVRIMQAAYNHIKELSAVDAISFSLVFGLEW